MNRKSNLSSVRAMTSFSPASLPYTYEYSTPDFSPSKSSVVSSAAAFPRSSIEGRRAVFPLTDSFHAPSFQVLSLNSQLSQNSRFKVPIMKSRLHRSLLVCSLSTLLSSIAFAQPIATQPPMPTQPEAAPPTITVPAPVVPKTSVAPKASVAPTPVALQAPPLNPDPNAIGVKINGRAIIADPAPVLKKGSVFVPLRGVLESLGAKVSFDSRTSRVDIEQSGEKYSLRVGQSYAIAGAKIVPLSAAPVYINGRAYVPLRALAELFGYRVNWLSSVRTVAINTDKTIEVRPVEVKTPPVKTPEPKTPPLPVVTASINDHRAALKRAGRFGVTINFHDAPSGDVPRLLDAAKAAGATLVKFRFDWNALEPEKGAAFQWPIYDSIVKQARARDLTIVGVLGNSAHWATRLPNTKNVLEWRNSAPLTTELPSWANYVRRVVGRYKNDVEAWQVWENPATYNFRAGDAKDYRVVTRRAIEAARIGDSKSLVFAAEPGGVNLGFIEEMRRNGLTPLLNGVSLYPVSQWQPGVVAQPEEMVLPIGTLEKEPANRNEDFWVSGLSRLSLETPDLQMPQADSIFRSKDHDLRRNLAQRFTPQAQADYLVRASTLALACGAEKVFWGALRDEPEYDLVDPVNSLYGNGLLRRDMSARPAFAAQANLARIVGNKNYAGAILAGPRVIILAFKDAGKDGESGSAVAWAIPGAGEAKLVLNPERDPEVPNSIFVSTAPDSKVLSSTGEELGGAAGAFTLTSRPIWITQLSSETLQSLSGDKKLMRVASLENSEIPADGLRAVFAPGASGAQDGLYWRKYSGFRGAATEFRTIGESAGLMTTYSRDIYNPAAGQPYIYLDVANEYLYFARGAPVRVTVEVKRPVKTEGAFAATGGFNVQYDSPTGFKSTPWQIVEGGDGWATFSFDIPDVSFAGRDGFDLLINTWGSRQDLVFRSITVRSLETRAARTDAAGSTQ